MNAAEPVPRTQPYSKRSRLAAPSHREADEPDSIDQRDGDDCAPHERWLKKPHRGEHDRHDRHRHHHDDAEDVRMLLLLRHADGHGKPADQGADLINQ
jgi:hypothetical protein